MGRPGHRLEGWQGRWPGPWSAKRHAQHVALQCWRPARIVACNWAGLDCVELRCRGCRACKDVASTNSLSKIVDKKKAVSSGQLARMSSDLMKDDFADRQAQLEVR